jgi:hypothetical protein
MNIVQWLYADPADGPSQPLLPILQRQFPTATLCSNVEQILNNIDTKPGKHVVLMLPRQDGTVPLDQSRKHWQDELKILCKKNIECVLFITEIFTINTSFDWICSISNLLIVTPCQHNFGKNNYPWITWQHWLHDAADSYKHPALLEYTDKFDSTQIKPMLFDVLLGGERPYRTMIHDWIEEDSILSPNTIMAYYGGNTARPKFIYEPDMVVPETQHFHTSIHCSFKEVEIRIACVPPVSVYQQCAYSLVTETSAQHDFVFFTEKIARVMICRRLFVVLSSYRYLHYLREAGFQTFNSIINESYDLEVDDQRRWRMAFEQMQQLAKRDQQEVLGLIQPIVAHNRQVLLTTDWHGKMSAQVNQVLDARLGLNLKPA